MMSLHGTFEACRRALRMSAHRVRPEVAAHGNNDAIDPQLTSFGISSVVTTHWHRSFQQIRRDAVPLQMAATTLGLGTSAARDAWKLCGSVLSRFFRPQTATAIELPALAARTRSAGFRCRRCGAEVRRRARGRAIATAAVQDRRRASHRFRAGRSLGKGRRSSCCRTRPSA